MPSMASLRGDNPRYLPDSIGMHLLWAKSVAWQVYKFVASRNLVLVAQVQQHGMVVP
jgi:hypothetical protein